jgi:hypothetical protein
MIYTDLSQQNKRFSQAPGKPWNALNRRGQKAMLDSCPFGKGQMGNLGSKRYRGPSAVLARAIWEISVIP